MPVSDIQEVTALIDGGRAAEVVPTLEYLTGLFPTSVTAHVLLARAYEAEGDHEWALSEWRWASSLVPNSPVAQRGMERALHALAEAPYREPNGQAEPFPPELVPPEVDEFVDLTEQPDMSPHFFAGQPVEETSAMAPEFEPPDSLYTAPLEPPPIRAAPAREAPIDDLDRLIAELESARITPDPDISAMSVYEAEDDDDDVVSETLARIYAAQRQYLEAARVYEKLAQQQPDRAAEFTRQAEELRMRAAED